MVSTSTAGIPVRTRVMVGLAATAVVSVVAGCATVPSGGAPQQVKTGGNQVQAYPQALAPPGPNRSWVARQVVLGFLHASASYAFDSAAAKQFLLQPLRASWHPKGAITVVSKIGKPKTTIPVHSPLDASNAGGPSESVEFNGTRLATLSQTGQYQYSPRTATYRFSLQRVNGVWLISALPPGQSGLVLTQADFEHEYQARNLFFFALPLSPSDGKLVPDPVYAPLQNSDSALNTNLASGLVKGLLNDQGWLSGATRTAFPPHTKLLGITIRGQTAVVDLGGAAVHANPTLQEGMAEQLEDTLGSTAYSPALAHFVQLEINGRTVAPGPFTDLIDELPKGSLAYQSGLSSVSEVPGSRSTSLGPAQLGSAAITAIAISGIPQAGQVAVGVKDENGCQVLKPGQGRPTAPFRSFPLSTSGGACTSLSWDSNGNLWAAAGHQIWVLGAQGAQKVAVALPAHLTPGGQPAPRIIALRMAPDGVRAALLIKTAAGGSRLALAAVREVGKQFSLGPAVAAGTALGNPIAMSWFSPYDLMVLEGSGDIAEVPLAGGTAELLGSAPSEAVSLTTNGVTIVVGTADNEILTSSNIASSNTAITWSEPVKGAIPIYPG